MLNALVCLFFLGQAGSSVHSPLPVHQSHHMSSGLLNKTSNSLTNYSSNYAGGLCSYCPHKITFITYYFFNSNVCNKEVT